MADEQIPDDPAGAYRAIIDECVRFASDARADRIRNGWPLSPNQSDTPEDQFVKSLSSGQRQILAGLLDDARRGGVHDLLSLLSWWIECHGLRLTYRGQPVPVDFSGMGLHGDFIGRLAPEDRWEWPERPPAPPPPWEKK